MMATNTNICNSNFCNLSTTDFNGISCIKIDDMDSFWSRLGHRFNDHIVIRVGMDIVVKEVYQVSILTNKCVSEWLLTNLAL